MGGVNATAAAGATGSFGRSPVIPVVTIDDPRRAVDLARALVAGGLTAIEVTLRTPAALDCIRAVAGEVEGLVVGAGTVLDARQADEAMKAGARFLVSPGATESLIEAVREAGCRVAAGRGHRRRGDAARRGRFCAVEILPGRAVGRRRLPQGGGAGSARHPLLPDRRRRRQECVRLSRAAERVRGRRLLGRAVSSAGKRGLRGDRKSCPRRRRATRLKRVPSALAGRGRLGPRAERGGGEGVERGRL